MSLATPPIVVSAFRLTVDGESLDFLGGSLLGGADLMARPHWSIVGVVRGSYDAPGYQVTVDVSTAWGRFRGNARVASDRIVDGAEVRTGITASAEGLLEAV